MGRVRYRKCHAPGCGRRYRLEPRDPSFRKWCSIECAVVISMIQRDRQRVKFAERKRKALKRKVLRQKAEDRLEENVQKQFNRFIRARDHGLPCVTCGKLKPLQCGHHRSVGSFPTLRYDTRNANGQCGQCNNGSAKFRRNEAQVAERYDAEVARRFGKKRLDWLWGPHPARQYRNPDLKRLLAVFRRRANHYEKLRGIS